MSKSNAFTVPKIRQVTNNRRQTKHDVFSVAKINKPTVNTSTVNKMMNGIR